MKYKHDFKLFSSTENSFIFKSDDSTKSSSNINNVRLDFFNHVMRAAIYKDDAKLLPTFSICPGDSKISRNGRPKLSTEGFEKISPEFSFDEKNNIFSVRTDDAEISVELFNFRMKVENENGILYQDRDYISYNFDNELGKGSMHFISREPDEQIFGLGDKTGDVNKNKKCFKLATSDSMGFDARYSDPLYKQIPFYICKNSSGSYGIFYDTYSNGEINFGVEHNNYYQAFKSFRCEEESLVFYVIFGDIPQIVQQFAWMCGRQMLPPKWSLQYCGSTMAYTDAPDADNQLRNFIALCKKYGFKPGGFYLSSGYTQIGEKRYVFNWNKEKIPSPQDLSAYFKQNGVEFIPNVKPAFLTDHFLYEEIAEKGWFLHYKDGTPAIFPFWSGFGSYLDFTNKDAFDFWTDCVKKQLVDKGYKNIWNDNNEYDVCDEEVYAAGFGEPISAKKIRPLFSYLMTLSSLEAQKQSAGENRTFAVTRSGIAGLQRICMTWTGDNNTNFDDFRYNHKMAMTMSLSGIYNFGQDIGGFAGPTPTKELFLRWIQYGIFTPRFVLHSWNPDGSSTMPWLFPEEISTVKKLFDLRQKLIPYLYNQVYRSYCDYNPIIYPVFLKYPDYDTESDAFFFGDDILACPIFDKGAEEVSVNLPPDKNGWYFNDVCYKNKVTLPCTIHDLPVYFVKGGSIIPTQTENGDLIFTIYAPDTISADNSKAESKSQLVSDVKTQSFSFSYLKDDGITNLSAQNYEIIKIDVLCSKDKIEAKIISSKKLNIHLVDSQNRSLNVEFIKK